MCVRGGGQSRGQGNVKRSKETLGLPGEQEGSTSAWYLSLPVFSAKQAEVVWDGAETAMKGNNGS